MGLFRSVISDARSALSKKSTVSHHAPTLPTPQHKTNVRTHPATTEQQTHNLNYQQSLSQPLNSGSIIGNKKNQKVVDNNLAGVSSTFKSTTKSINRPANTAHTTQAADQVVSTRTKSTARFRNEKAGTDFPSPTEFSINASKNVTKNSIPNKLNSNDLTSNATRTVNSPYSRAMNTDRSESIEKTSEISNPTKIEATSASPKVKSASKLQSARSDSSTISPQPKIDSIESNFTKISDTSENRSKQLKKHLQKSSEHEIIKNRVEATESSKKADLQRGFKKQVDLTVSEQEKSTPIQQESNVNSRAIEAGLKKISGENHDENGFKPKHNETGRFKTSLDAAEPPKPQSAVANNLATVGVIEEQQEDDRRKQEEKSLQSLMKAQAEVISAAERAESVAIKATLVANKNRSDSEALRTSRIQNQVITAAPSSPDVRIGRVDVFVASPAPGNQRNRSSNRPAFSMASRHFLRRL